MKSHATLLLFLLLVISLSFGCRKTNTVIPNNPAGTWTCNGKVDSTYISFSSGLIDTNWVVTNMVIPVVCFQSKSNPYYSVNHISGNVNVIVIPTLAINYSISGLLHSGGHGINDTLSYFYRDSTNAIDVYALGIPNSYNGPGIDVEIDYYYNLNKISLSGIYVTYSGIGVNPTVDYELTGIRK